MAKEGVLAEPVEMMIWDSGFGMGDSQAEVEECIAVWIKNCVVTHQLVEHNTSISKPSAKWRASSAMQKAIRRGLSVTAERMAWGLHALDPEYVWRRLPVIAVEDIGVANIPLVAAVLWVSGKTKWREQNGGDAKILQALIVAMSHSVKDRSVCDLVVWVDSCPDLAEKRAMMDATVGDKPAVFMADHEFLADRMLAGWALAGTQTHKGDNVPPDIFGSITSVLNYCEALPRVVRLIMRWGSTKFGDAMPVAYPLIWEMAQKTWADGPDKHGKHCGIYAEPDDLMNLGMIGTNYPSAAFDWHCAEGKRALSYFNAACPPMAEFLTMCGIGSETVDDKKARRLATSSLLFRVEGSQVNKRLVFEGSRDLYDLAELALNRACGIRGDLNDWGMELMRANMPMMHHARLVVMDAFPAGKKVKSPDSFHVMQPNQTVAGDTMWVDHGMLQVVSYQDLTPAAVEPSWAASPDPAPGHTDLMVSPDAIDDVLEDDCVGAGVISYGAAAASDNLPPIKKKLVIKSKPKPGTV